MKTEPIDIKPGVMDEEWTVGSAGLPISLLSSSEPADSDSTSSSDFDSDSDSDSVPETDSDSESESDMDLDSERDELDEDVKPEVKLELSLPTDVPLPTPSRPGDRAAGVGCVKVETSEVGGTEEIEDADRTRVDDMLDLDAAPVPAQHATTIPPANGPAAPVSTRPLPSILNVHQPVLEQPRQATAPRPPSPHTEEEDEPEGPTIRITQYTTYSPAVVEAVVRAAAPHAFRGSRLFYGVDAYTPPDNEDAKLSVIVIPPIEGGWAVALVSHKQGWGRVIAAPPVFLPTPASTAPAAAAFDIAGPSTGPSTNPGVSAGSFATGPLAARLSRACPGLEFHRIPLGGVPALGEKHAGVWACTIALWLIRWPWDPSIPARRGFQFISVNMARARREHRDLLAGMQLRALAVKTKVPKEMRGKGKKGKGKKQKGSEAEKARRQALEAEGIARAELKRQRREENERNAARNAEKKRARKEKEEQERKKLEKRNKKAAKHMSEKERGNLYREQRLKRKAEKQRALAEEERALNGTPAKKHKKDKNNKDTPIKVKTEPGASTGNTPKQKKQRQNGEVRVKTEPGTSTPRVAVKQEPL